MPEKIELPPPLDHLEDIDNVYYDSESRTVPALREIFLRQQRRIVVCVQDGKKQEWWYCAYIWDVEKILEDHPKESGRTLTWHNQSTKPTTREKRKQIYPAHAA